MLRIVKDSEISLGNLRAANHSRQIEWDNSRQITPEYSAIEFAGEVGELLNVVKKIFREKLHLRGTRATHQDLENEMADVLITLDLLAMRMNVDLTAALRRKFNDTSDKLGLRVML